MTIDDSVCACGSHRPRITEIDRIADHFSLFGHTFEYAAFEAATLTAVTELRARSKAASDLGDVAALEDELETGLQAKARLLPAGPSQVVWEACLSVFRAN